MGFRKIDDFLNVYITSDLHLSYTLNRSIQKRGFNNPIEHTRTLRNNINNISKSHSDVLIINGDFTSDMDLARVFLKEITPKDIWLTLGNHCHKKQLQVLFKEGLVSRIEHELKLNWRGESYHIQHLPLREFDGMYRNSYHWFGHTHGTLKPYLRAMDFGLDNCDLKPRLITDIVELRSQYSNIDEYGKRIEL